MTIDDAGIKKGLRHCAESECGGCPYESCCMLSGGVSDLARDALEYIEVLESSLKEYLELEEGRRNREHASNWIKYWREKHGEMTLAYPDWDEIFKDWEEAHALAQSRLRRMRLFKSRAQRYMVDANHYRMLYTETANERDAAVKDIRKAAWCCCHVCKHYYQPDPNVGTYSCKKYGDFDKHDFIADDGSIFCGAMEWRGPEVE